MGFRFQARNDATAPKTPRSQARRSVPSAALSRRLYADPKLRALKSLRFHDRPPLTAQASPAPAAIAAHINDS
jgi:hypothetical protein